MEDESAVVNLFGLSIEEFQGIGENKRNYPNVGSGATKLVNTLPPLHAVNLEVVTIAHWAGLELNEQNDGWRIIAGNSGWRHKHVGERWPLRKSRCLPSRWTILPTRAGDG